MWGVHCWANCPAPVHVRCGTVVVGWSGMGGKLWYGVGIAGGTVSVRCRYGYELYITVLYGKVHES
jgi:hypothetical protein